MIPRMRQLAIAASSGVLLMLPMFTGTSHAVAAPPDYVYAEPLAKSDAEMRKVAEYWKPERLKDADSYSPATPGTKSSTPSSSPSSSAGSVLTNGVSRRATARDIQPTAPAKGGAAKTIGKVFFQLGGKEYWCSASAVAAKNRSLVATAGHCAWDPPSRQERQLDLRPQPRQGRRRAARHLRRLHPAHARGLGGHRRLRLRLRLRLGPPRLPLGDRGR
ncbi:hypothetical protein [Nonomuraea dietziae]|uniref:hypothetical protein n=1 Tax=Nonomuraea dietziae TaxID=65515 RepID=UPI0031CF2B4A